jgi:hypothetical protein
MTTLHLGQKKGMQNLHGCVFSWEMFLLSGKHLSPLQALEQVQVALGREAEGWEPGKRWRGEGVGGGVPHG